MRRLTHIAFASLLYIFSQSHALAAGTFTPAEGAEITQSPFSVSWETSASQQWVRAYDAATGDKFFDSGRLRTGSGSVSVDVPENVSDISVIFYEFTGAWESQERSYAVNLGSGGGGDSGGSGGSVIISERISCEAGLIDYSLFVENGIDLLLNGGRISECDLLCPEGEYLIAATCNAGWFTGDVNLAYNAVVAELRQSDNYATCTAYAAISSDPWGDSPDDGSEPVFILSASGACLSLPD